ncbi:hypothetical protein Vi05172_g8550 [Venturia inaequalis]|nr:hypothetical protein Vi05172_g8550 [Venturia inaequalis]
MPTKADSDKNLSLPVLNLCITLTWDIDQESGTIAFSAWPSSPLARTAHEPRDVFIKHAQAYGDTNEYYCCI